MLNSFGRLLSDRIDLLTTAGVWAKRIAQDASLPAVEYELTLGDRTGGTAPLVPALLAVNCYAATSDACEALAAQMIAGLNGWSGRGYGVGLLQLQMSNTSQDVDDKTGVFFAALTFGGVAVTGG